MSMEVNNSCSEYQLKTRASNFTLILCSRVICTLIAEASQNKIEQLYLNLQPENNHHYNHELQTWFLLSADDSKNHQFFVCTPFHLNNISDDNTSYSKSFILFHEYRVWWLLLEPSIVNIVTFVRLKAKRFSLYT